MADDNNTIDQLNIKIKSDTTKAVRSLDMLSDSLRNTGRMLSSVGSANAREFSRSIGTADAALKSFARTARSLNLANFNSQLKQISKINFSNLSNINTSGLQDFGRALSSVNGLMQSLNNVNLSDTGINAVINSIRRLAGVDLSAFDGGKFAQIISNISALGSLPDISNSTSRLVSSLARLAGAGNEINIVADNLPRFGDALTDVANRLAGTSTISEGTNQLVQSISNLANAGDRVGQTTSNLSTFGDSMVQLFGQMQQAPVVSANTVRMTQALAQLASSGYRAGSATRAISSSLGSMALSTSSVSRTISISLRSIIDAFKKMSSAVKSAISGLAKITKGILTTNFITIGQKAREMASKVTTAFTGIGKASSGLDKANISLTRLLKTILPFLGIRQLFQWGKESTKIASDLVEVENVVRGVFGEYTKGLEDLSKKSITDYGISELTVKKTASRFQAMGVAMGMSQKEMSKTSVELTKLAADMASFYNSDVDDVSKKLESIFTGSARPLREFGIDLTQATLKEWALANGMNANISSMTQAEKAMLRYNYVMDRASVASGDFARTSGSWANQCRILSENLKALGSTVGTAIINILRPVIVWLNKAMVAIISVVQTIANALGAIFGWTMEIDASGTSQDLDDMADSMSDVAGGAGDAAGGMKDANKNAKELRKTLLGFDEINKLNDDTGSTSGGGSGGGGGGGGVGGGGASAELVRTDSIFKKMESEISSLEELGTTIGNALKNAMDRINWQEIYEKARNFGNGLASFMNGLITPGLFDSLGNTVAGTLNTAFNFLDSFGDKFNWVNFGNSIGSGINSFMQRFNLRLVAGTATKFSNGIATAIIAKNEKIKWGRIGWKIADSMNRYIKDTNWTKIGTAVSSGINGVFKLASTWSKKFNFKKLGSAVKDTIKSTVNGINWENVFTFAEETGTGIATAFNEIITTDTLSSIGSTFSNAVQSVITGAYSFFKNADWTEWGKAIASSINTFFSTMSDEKWAELGLTIETALDGIITTLENLADNLDGEEIGRKIGIALGKIDFKDKLKRVGKLIWRAIKSAIKEYGKLFKAKPVETAITTALLGLKFSGLKKGFGSLVWGAIKAAIFGSKTATSAPASKTGGLVAGIGTTLKTAFSSGKAIGGIKTGLASAFQSAVDLMGGAGSASFQVIANPIVEGISDKVKELLPSGLVTAIDNAGAGFVLGGATGAAAGSVLPGIGTIGGAVAGGILGAIGNSMGKTEWGTKLKEEVQKNLNNNFKETTLDVKPKDIKIVVDEFGNETETITFDDGSYKVYVNGVLQEMEDGLSDDDKKISGIEGKVDSVTTKKNMDPLSIDKATIKDVATEKGKTYILDVMANLKDKVTSSKTFQSLFGLTSDNQMSVWAKLKDVASGSMKLFSEDGKNSLFKTIFGVKPKMTSVADGSLSLVSEDGKKALFKKIIDVYANMKGKAEGSKTLSGTNNALFNNILNVRAALIGKAKDSLNVGSVNSKGKETGKPGVFGPNFNILANLTGKASGSKSVVGDSKDTSVFRKDMEVKANLSGKSSDSKELVESEKKKGVFGPDFDVMANLTGKKDSIPDDQRKVGSFKATITGKEDSISDKTLGSFKAEITDKEDKIPTWKKVLKDFTAWVSGSSPEKAAGGVFANGKWNPIQQYAVGGSPGTGQLFLARESGPELVSTLRGHTAVMNNDQIVSSVSAGVYKAVASAMNQVAGSLGGGNQTVELYIDGKKVTNSVIKYHNQQVRRTGYSPLMI